MVLLGAVCLLHFEALLLEPAARLLEPLDRHPRELPLLSHLGLEITHENARGRALVRAHDCIAPRRVVFSHQRHLLPESLGIVERPLHALLRFKPLPECIRHLHLGSILVRLGLRHHLVVAGKVGLV